MITEKEKNENKETFLDLVRSINRPNMNKELLIKQLIESDFFDAPASTQYNNSFDGGLCKHCLQVYTNLSVLCKLFYPNPISEDSIKIVSLFHDFSKMNYYVGEIKNKKVYSDKGSKSDSMGKYDWVSVPGYTVKPANQRFGVGTPAENSAYMVNTFIPLTFEEYSAILNVNGGMTKDDSPIDMWKKHPLSLLLHQADCLAAFIQENNE